MGNPSEPLLTDRARAELHRVLLVIDPGAVAGPRGHRRGHVLVAHLAHPLLDRDVVRLPRLDLPREVALDPVPWGDLAEDGLYVLAGVSAVQAPRVDRSSHVAIDRAHGKSVSFDR